MKEWLVAQHGYADAVATVLERYQQQDNLKGRLLSWMRPAPRARVLDVGCGVGYFLFDIARAFADRELTCVGIDVNLSRVALFRQRIVDERAERFFAHCGDGEGLPFRRDTFDIVVASEVLEHVSAPERLLQSMWNVLRPGGAAFLSSPNGSAGVAWDRWLSTLLKVRHLFFAPSAQPMRRAGGWSTGAEPFFDRNFSTAQQASLIASTGFEIVRRAETNRAAPLVAPLTRRFGPRGAYAIVSILERVLPPSAGLSALWHLRKPTS